MGLTRIVTSEIGKYQNGLIVAVKLQAYSVSARALYSSENALIIRPEIHGKATGVLEKESVLSSPYQ